MKTMILEMKNDFDGLITRLKTVEERISELGDNEVNRNSNQNIKREKSEKKKNTSIRTLQDNSKQLNINK